ncbi:MAG: hypothetical protein QXN66_06470 [Thermoplasmatales archaeon]
MQTVSEKLRKKRALILNSFHNPLLICRENPLFSYFSSDNRAECVLVKNSIMENIGNKEVNDKFGVADESTCILQPFFNYRPQKACEFSEDELFQFPLNEEVRIIKECRKEIEAQVVSELSNATTESTERQVVNAMKKRICSIGIDTFYEPIVSFDENTREIWHKPGNSKIGKLSYVEIACNINGISSLYSETFLFSDIDYLSLQYKNILNAIELIKKNFVEGESTSYVSTILDNFRNEKLYLTNPLFPFKCHLMPGEEEVVHTGDIAVFDLWNRAGNTYIRKKVMALAGSYRAEIL